MQKKIARKKRTLFSQELANSIETIQKPNKLRLLSATIVKWSKCILNKEHLLLFNLNGMEATLSRSKFIILMISTLFCFVGFALVLLPFCFYNIFIWKHFLQNIHPIEAEEVFRVKKKTILRRFSAIIISGLKNSFSELRLNSWFWCNEKRTGNSGKSPLCALWDVENSIGLFPLSIKSRYVKMDSK